MSHTGYTTEEVARRGRKLYEREIRARVEDEHAGKFLVVDIDTGEYALDEDEIAAFDHALAKNSHAVLFGLRVGEPAAHRIGGAVIGPPRPE